MTIHFNISLWTNPTVIDNTTGIHNDIPRSHLPYFIHSNLLMFILLLWDNEEVHPIYHLSLSGEYLHVFDAAGHIPTCPHLILHVKVRLVPGLPTKMRDLSCE